MCLLSYFPPGVTPVRRHLDNGADHNPDGHGWAVITEGSKLLSGKSMNATAAIDEFMAARAEHPRGPALFHSRISTGGGVNLYNCHPFEAGGDPETVIAHNGILFSPPSGEKRSDTRIFAEDIFPRLYRRLDRDGVRKNLHEYLYGKNSFYSNKLIVLTVNPRYKYGAYLFGAHKGDWVEGENTIHDNQVPGLTAWHSNNGWEIPSYKYAYTGKYTGKYTGHTEWWEDDTWRSACQFCGTPQAVDSVTAICTACKICTDCGTDMYECLCYVPSERRN